MDDRPYHNQSREAWSASGIAQDPHAAASAVRRSQQATNSAAREQAERALAARVASMIGQRPSQVPAGSAVAALRASGGGSLNRPPSPASSAGSMSMPPVAGASAPSIANPPPQMQGGPQRPSSAGPVNWADRSIHNLNDQKWRLDPHPQPSTANSVLSQNSAAGRLAAENAVLREELKRMPEELLRISSCLLYTSPSPRDRQKSRMPSSA